MRIGLWLLGGGLALLALGFATLAFRTADREYEGALRDLEDAAAREGAALARRMEPPLHDAERAALAHARDDTAVDSADVFLLDDAALESDSVESDPIESDPMPPETTATDADLYRRAIRAGETCEFERADFARAIDAYTFTLARLTRPELRARLLLRAGRAALGHHDPLLARAMFDAAIDISRHLSADRWPIELQSALFMGDRAAIAGLLLTSHRTLTSHQLATLVSLYCPDDSEVAALSRARVAIDATTRSRGLERASRSPRLPTNFLVMPIEARNRAGLAVARVDFPALELPGFAVTVGDRAPISPAAWSGELRLADGTAIGWLNMEDVSHAVRRTELARRRGLWRLASGLLAVLTIAAGAALLLGVARERRLNAVRFKLLANVSHELKTPVTSMRILADALASDALNGGEVRRYGGLIVAESRRLGQRIADILDLSRARREARPLASTPTNLRAVLTDVLNGFQFQADAKGVAIRRSGLEVAHGNVLVATNGVAVERIVANLLDNALKYRAKLEPWIELRLSHDRDRIRIAVADNGIGIAAADRARIFDEFYRARFDDYGIQGAGIGLAIARVLAAQLGGKLTVESALGAGSTFTLELPVTSVESGSQLAATRPSPSPP
ncbi:MAG: sensor histidine kinase [Planctomycetota bacterium]